MKKLLIAISVSLLIASSVYAAETFTGSFLEAQQKKLDAQTSKIVNKEKELRATQQAINPVNKVNNTKNQQIELIDKKKQQIQSQKDALNKEKEEFKSLFTIK